MSSVPLLTKIENTAAIYFDYNSPTITNNAWVTISHYSPEDYNLLKTLILTSTEEDLQNEEMTIYPNPTNNNIYVKLKDTRSLLNVKLVNTRGVVIQTKRVTEEIVSFEITHLPSGVYLIQLTNANGNSSKRFIKN